MLTEPPIIFRIVCSSADLGLRSYFLDDRQRQHVLLGHRGLQSAMIAIQSAVEGPTAIYRSKNDDNRFVFLSANVQTGRSSQMKVIVERVGDEGKVITATWAGVSYSGQLVWDASGALYTNYDDQHDVFYISKGATTDEYADDDPEFDTWLRKREDDDTPQGVTIFGLKNLKKIKSIGFLSERHYFWVLRAMKLNCERVLFLQEGPEMITLSEALRSNRLEDFIAQEEARGVGAIDRAEFDRLLGKAVKAPQSEDQTSRFPSRDGLTGKLTRQGNGRHISS